MGITEKVLEELGQSVVPIVTGPWAGGQRSASKDQELSRSTLKYNWRQSRTTYTQKCGTKLLRKREANSEKAKEYRCEFS
jgi:hypothetical protein